MISAADIKAFIPFVLEETNFDFLGKKKSGKVRDVYDDGKQLHLVATDRYSAFDRNLALIPLKGQALTQTSLVNFRKTEDIIRNHVRDNPDPNVLVCEKCTVAPIEVIVRGYLSGVTETSLWTRYANGQRDFTDFVLSDGLKKNEQLPRPVITPTTKFEEHDRNLTSGEVVSEGYLSAKQWKEIQDVALALFTRGQDLAKEAGLILVDTKYEFGYDRANRLMLIDEVHTQDSSRYWKADSYELRMSEGKEPEYYDKEFLRLWFKDHSNPYADELLPSPPEEMTIILAQRYIEIYERLSNNQFDLPPLENVVERIAQNILSLKK